VHRIRGRILVAAHCKRHTRDVRLGVAFLYVSLQSLVRRSNTTCYCTEFHYPSRGQGQWRQRDFVHTLTFHHVNLVEPKCKVCCSAGACVRFTLSYERAHIALRINNCCLSAYTLQGRNAGSVAQLDLV